MRGKRAKSNESQSQPKGKTPAKSEQSANKSKAQASKKAEKRPISKSKTPDKGITLKNQAKPNPLEVVFKEGEFAGIVDARASNEERFDSFTLVQIAEASKKGDAEVRVRPYRPGKKDNLYERAEEDSIMVQDYQILSTVKVKAEKKDLSSVKISVSDANKLNNMFENQIDSIKEKLGISDGDEESEKEEEEAKNSAGALENDPILVAKRTLDAAQKFTQPAKSKSVQRRKKKADSDDEEEDDEAEDESLLETIGKKRSRAPAASQSVPRRVKKMSDGTEKEMPQTQKAKKVKEPKPPKEPKWKSVLKIGKWNPNTKLLQKELEKTGGDNQPHFNCCLSCNARNVYRAITTKNAALLKAVIFDVKNIPYVNPAGWSANSQWHSLVTLIMTSQDKALMKTAFDVDASSFRAQVMMGSNQDQDHFALEQLFVHKRAQCKPYLLNLIQQGQVSYKAYGTRIRQVEMTRGNRQGNNAFLDHGEDGGFGNNAQMPNFGMHWFEQQFFFRNLTPEFYKQLSVTKVFKNQHNFFDHQMHIIARTGNRKLLLDLVEPMLKHEMYGFNQLHIDVLKFDKLDQKYATQSLTKKATQACNVTPLHFACINPNVAVLQKILDQNQELHVTDNENWKPIHYAAACEGSGPLELLLKLGASVFDITFKKENPLHIAAINGRAGNIKALLANNTKIAKARDRMGNTPMVYALMLGELEPINAFLESGAVKIGSTHGKERMTPLHYAAAQGNYELVEHLLEKKAKVLAKDKFKRTPLIHACKNGHAKVASLLLQHGSDWNQTDSSQNYPLHYAAGYGWLECINLLLEHGAEINSNNMWKVSPITIAMLKNHTGIVKELMQHEGVDVNGKDDKGLTLLHMACVDLSKHGIVDFVKYLLDKGADPNLADLDGQTPLHNLAFYRSAVRQKRMAKRNHDPNVDTDYNDSIKAEQQARLDVIDLLIQYKGNLNAQTNDGDTPFSIALKQNEISVLHKFVDNVKLSESPQLFHNFTNHIFDHRYSSLLVQLIKKENYSSEVANVLNKDGFTPFLAYIRHFAEQVDLFENAIKNELQYAEWKKKQHFGNHVIQNIHIFDVTCNSNSDTAYNEWRIQNAVGGTTSYFNEFELKDMTAKNLARLVTKPFIELLTLMVEAGADPLAKVDKLEFYRELDKHKQKMFLVEETREGVGIVNAEMKQSSENEPKSATVASTNAVKSRKEVLAERNYEKKVLRNQNRGSKGKTDEAQEKKRELHKKLKAFYAEKAFQPRFEKINGKKVEQEYVAKFGLQNAMHLHMKRPVKELFDFLIEVNRVPIDEIDNEGLNPFYININSRILMGKDQLSQSAKQLITMGANCDLPDRQGQTPFMQLYSKVYKDAAFYLLDKGANINAMSKVGVFALKMALIRRNNDDIKELVSRGADINQVDHLGRNLLHEAVKMSSATADATFETEQLIIDLGVKVNLRDQFGRVPLHYAFVKNSRSTLDQGYGISTDPIETVSSMCAQKNIEIDVADKWKKTPLHYASMMGSTISVIYMIQRGASTKSVDIYGNTPLGVAMLYRQFNYAITLIQKDADVKVPVYEEFPNRVDKMWADEEKAREKELRAAAQNVDMTESEHSDDEEEKAPNKATRDLFAKKPQRFAFDDDYDDEYDDEYDSSDESEGSVMEKQVYGQNAFGLPNQGMRMAGAKVKKVARKATGGWGGTIPAQQRYPGEPQPVSAPSTEIEPVQEPKSTFRHAIKNGQQGVAYLILDNGYDYMLAMQDAMDENKFQLVLTLLSKTSDDRVIQRKNAKGQNLMHILSQNAQKATFQVLERIYKTLKQRGVDCLASDNQRNNALHFAVQSMSTSLVQILLAEGIDVNSINSAGHSPLSLYFVACKTEKGLSNLRLSQRLIGQAVFNNSMIEMLARAGANFNHKYVDYKEPAKPKSPAPVTEESKDEIEAEDTYQSTIIINQIKNCDEFLHRDAPDYDMNAWNRNRFGQPQSAPVQQQQPVGDSHLLTTLEYLMRNGAQFNVTDSKGRDVMSYAIENNDLSLVKFLISNKVAHKLLINSQDNQGRSAVHFVVNPVGFGTYENTAILDELHRAGYRFDLKDKEGLSPLDYAMEQSSGVLAAKIQEKLGARVSKAKGAIVRQNSFTPAANWPVQVFYPEADSQQMLAEAEAKQHAEMMEKDSTPDYIPRDVAVKDEKQYKVFYDDEKRPFDCYLTKVDLANGLYGAYLFYKIQLLHDTNRDLYVVLTRYGRIGEVGMNQRSPFNNAADAIADFSTIFKAKTGNEWASAHTDFVKMPKKYNLVQVQHHKVKHQDYLAPFDFESCKPGEKLSKKVMNFVEEISNVTMYQRAIQDFRVDTDLLPISGLKKETLLKAKEILAEIKDILEGKLNQYYSRKDDAFAEKQALAETLGELSSKYFELIPMKENEDQPAAPMRNLGTVSRQSELLSTLINVEYSSRILLGALYRQYQVNPIEYIYDCMAAKIQIMSKSDPETKLISAYCENTAGRDLKNIRIFKIERKGEAERFAPYKKEANRMLLFHGSGMSNYLGILSQGLRIAPPEAPATGYMFGKGVYFADMFKKSDAYASGVTSKVLILCEVALGKMQKLYEAKYIENLDRPFMSVKGCGRNGPDLKNKLVITPSGFAVPSGLPMKYPNRVLPQNQQNQNNWQMMQMQALGGYSLMHNEYIVYNTDQVRMQYLIQVDTK